jgi:GDPmannose 4,6-dehydratase
MKKALITGITGQDGSYLAEFLLEKNYEVIGVIRRKSKFDLGNAKYLKGQVKFVYGDLIDGSVLVSILRDHKPGEIYNLAAQSVPRDSWRQPIQTGEITGLGVVRLLEAVRQVVPKAKFYQASSSEMFGEIKESPQNENTPFNPVNPYAVAKLYAHYNAIVYRKSYKMFICCGILFNHEGPRRSPDFVTRKVSLGAACIKLKVKNPPLNEEGEPVVKDGKLSMGNLDAQRDWGFAGDYVRAMWMMLQQKKPDDFVIATGETHTVQELCKTAFDHVGLDWRRHVVVDPRFVRPTETGPLTGDYSKAKRVLGWKPETSFKELIEMMVDSDLASLK